MAREVWLRPHREGGALERTARHVRVRNQRFLLLSAACAIASPQRGPCCDASERAAATVCASSHSSPACETPTRNSRYAALRKTSTCTELAPSPTPFPFVFGRSWLAIIATGYGKAHGWFPDPEVALTYNQWGGLAQLGFNQYISNERAIIMIAHVHALGVSAAAAWGPQVLGDTLTLLDGEEDEEPYGLFPPFKGQTGLTPAAEMYNGRMAMMGLIAVITASLASGKDILEVVNIGTGGFLKSM